MELLKLLYRASICCRRTKRNTKSALAFEINLAANLVALRDALLDGTYRRGKSVCFVAQEGSKPREVWAADYVDRVVEWLVYNHISPIFHRRFIHDTFACIPGRGTMRAAERLEHHARGATQNWSRRMFFMKCDIANFFLSIHKPTVIGLLAKRVPAGWWLDLAASIIRHDPREDFEFRGSSETLQLVPMHKRLTSQDDEHGLAIGNLFSQFAAAVLLDVLDQFVKHELKIRRYVRYVDDFVIIDESPQRLNAYRARIEALLRDELRLELNPTKTILQPCSRGIDFVGQVIHPRGRTLRKRTRNRAFRRIERIAPDRLLATTNSYFGLARQTTRSHTVRRHIAKRALARGHAVNGTLTKAYRRAA